MNALSHLLRWPGRIGVAACVAAIRLYQVTLGPLVGPACRFEPTCSRYAIEALQKYGLLRGLWKGFGRLCRCHPLHPGGYDPP